MVKSYLLELLDSTLVNTTALVDQVTCVRCQMEGRGRDGEGGCRLTSGGRLARIDVADNDHVDVHLLLTARGRAVSEGAIMI